MYKQVGGNYWLLPTKNENKHVRFGSCLGILMHGGLAHSIAVSRRFADLPGCRALYCVVHVELCDILVKFFLVPALTNTDIRVTRVGTRTNFTRISPSTTCIRSWISPWEVFEARAFLQAVACYHYGIDFINQYVVTTMCALHAALDPCTKGCHYLTQVAPS
jgi:hypothetical protein